MDARNTHPALTRTTELNMAQANLNPTTRRGGSLPLSALFTDELVRRAFRRAEDDGCLVTLPINPRPLTDSAAEKMELCNV
jgi:hypothetical protein